MGKSSFDSRGRGQKEIRQWEWLLRKFWQISVVRSAALEAEGEASSLLARMLLEDIVLSSQSIHPES